MARCPTCGRRLVAGGACPVHPSERAPERPATSAVPPPWPDRVVRCLGEGGFATVWEVHPDDQPPYALKVAKAITDLANRRMRREARALAAVGAPWVPALHRHGVIDEDGHAYLAMELIRGDSLVDLIARGMDAERCRVILRGLLEAVAHLHAAGVIHRDLKPDNVIVGADGRVTVLDLGMARAIGGDASDPFAGAIAGSAEYMAPEQLDSGEVSERADVYSLGVIAFELCMQRPPFVGSAVEVQRGHRAMRPQRLLDAPAELDALCQEALRKEPAQRPSAAALLGRLDAGALTHDGGARRRGTAAISLVRERSQPVVLLWAELARLDRSVLATLGAHKFRVISQRGRRILAAISAGDHPTPSSEAMGVAEELVSVGARVVLHLADCVVSGERISGHAVSAPESWLPSGAWSGLRLTAAFSAAIHRGVAPARDAIGFYALSEQTATVLGRERVLAELVTMLDPQDGPGLVLVTGDVGVGKSTLADELSRRLIERGLEVWQTSVSPPGRDRGAGGGSQLFAELVPSFAERPLMPDQADELRALARETPLAVLLDDVDLAEHELLDAIEYMTLGGGEPCALWVVCFATGQLLERRPDLGRRAQRSHHLALPGLDEESAVALAARWLAPVDYLPLVSLRPLLSVAQGNPLHIVSLCRELRERGAIRQREDGGYYLDTASLEQLPTLALAPWMAARHLARLPEETIELARLCAVLGDSFDRGELAAIVDSLDESAGGRIAIDVGVGLGELVAGGLLEEDGPRLRFVNGLVCEGIYATLTSDERAAVHHLARDYWIDYWVVHTEDAVDQIAVPRIARHARAIGDRLWAGRTCAELARAADLAHRFVDAEQLWSAALQFVDDDSDRSEALVGRARARYRQQRMADAISDAREAAQLSRAVGDRERMVDALLEEATALDWAEDFATSAQRAEEARDCGTMDPGRQVRIDLAMSRATFRKRPSDATAELPRVLSRAVELGDHETAVIAAMLAAAAFLATSQLERARDMFAAAEASCDESGDRFHFAALLANRINLWSAMGLIERGLADLRDAIHLAREHGQAMIERSGAYNLAEMLLWQNQLGESFQWAQRSLALQERYGARAAVPDLLLTMRIAAARNERELVSQRLLAVPDDLGPADACFRDALETWLRPSVDAWRRVLSQADRVLEREQVLELGRLALLGGYLDQEARVEYRERALKSPVWRTTALADSFDVRNDTTAD